MDSETIKIIYDLLVHNLHLGGAMNFAITVSKLIEILKDMPEDATVMTIHELCSSDECHVESVELDEKHNRVILHNMFPDNVDRKRLFW